MRDLLKIIQERHSDRGSFDPNRPIPGRDLRLILEAARWAPTPHNMQNFEILVVDGKEQLDAIQKCRSDASESFLRENYGQLSFSEEELLAKKTGVLASMFPPSWTNPEAWRQDSDYRSQHAFLGRWMRESPMLLIVIHDARKRAPGSDGDMLGSVGLGCMMENMWLMSGVLGIGFQVLSTFSNDQVEHQVKSLLHIPEWMQISFACRLGYPAEQGAKPVRVRRTLEEFCHHNLFGRKGLASKDAPVSPPSGEPIAR